MKYSAILLALAVAVSAQDLTSLAADIPACALTALNAAATANGCGLTDFACQCGDKKQAITAAATPQVLTDCGTEAAQVLDATNALCAAVDAGATSGSSTSEAAAASTSEAAASTTAESSSADSSAAATTSAASSSSAAQSSASGILASGSSAVASLTSEAASKASSVASGASSAAGKATSAAGSATSAAAAAATGAAGVNVVNFGAVLGAAGFVAALI